MDVPGGNANSTEHRGQLKSVSFKLNAELKTAFIWFIPYNLQDVIEALLVWSKTSLDAACMRSEVELSIV